MEARDQLWQSFLETRVRIFADDAITELVIGREAPPRPEPNDGVHLITAWNPMGRPYPSAENVARQVEFESALSGAGLRWTRAAGVAEDGSWTEAGAAITGLDRAEALEVARRWDQEAIYEWDSEASVMAVVSCVDDRLWTRHVVPLELTFRPCPMRPPAERASTMCARPDSDLRRTMLWALGCDVCDAR